MSKKGKDEKPPPPPPPPRSPYDPFPKISLTKRVLFGTLSGMVATTLLHPLDFIKVRMQVDSTSYSSRALVEQIVKNEGLKTFYTGISAGLMRQATYTATRLAVYSWLYDNYKTKYDCTSISDKVAMGMYAGLLGAFFGNPSEVALVRMIAMSKPPPCPPCPPPSPYSHSCFPSPPCPPPCGPSPPFPQCKPCPTDWTPRPTVWAPYPQPSNPCPPPCNPCPPPSNPCPPPCNPCPPPYSPCPPPCSPCPPPSLPCTPIPRVPKPYNGVFDAFKRIKREEGCCALWRGTSLTMFRSVIVSVAQISSYLQVREMLLNCDEMSKKPCQVHIYSSIVSGFITAVLSLPVDFVKTRYQIGRNGQSPMSILKGVKERKGVLYLWKGFFPYFIRMTIHTIITFFILEQINQMYHKRLDDAESKNKNEKKEKGKER